MNWIRFIRHYLPTTIITILLLLVCDYIFGKYLIEKIYLEDERLYRIKDPLLHHSLAPNFNGTGIWGGLRYKICTNSAGFKDKCELSLQGGKDFDIAFIGDSFTEGIGLRYEDTFVGRIAQALQTQRIANLGVASYAPSIYLTKVKKALNDGFRFKELVVYVDISDIQDEAVLYELSSGRVVSQPPVTPPKIPNSSIEKTKIFMKSMFPLIYRGLFQIKRMVTYIYYGDAKVEPIYLDRDYSRGSWTSI